MDRSGVYENVVEATEATLRQALNDAPAFTNQVWSTREENPVLCDQCQCSSSV